MKKFLAVIVALVALASSPFITTSRATDLVVCSVRFIPDVIYVGDWITTVVTVTNAGTSNYTNPFSVNVQGSAAYLSFLPAGASRSVTISNAFSFGEPGTFSLNFGINAEDDDLGNNWVPVSMTIHPDTNKTFVWVTAPNGGEHLLAGKTYTITTVTNMLPVGTTVQLSLYYELAGNCHGGCEAYEDIIGSYQGGDFQWTVPAKYASSTINHNSYQIRAVLVGTNIPPVNPPQDYSDQFFNIEAQPCLISAKQGTASNSPVYELSGLSGFSYEIQGSTNLIDWMSVKTIFNASGVVSFSDEYSTNYPVRFYRALGQY